MQSTALVPASPAPASGALVTAEHFQPLLSVEMALKRKHAVDQIVKGVLVPGVDYGVQPGSTNQQKVLKKSGAEKMISTFGLAPQIAKEVKVLDWTGADHGGEPFFSYEYQIALYRGDVFLGEATASCNSWEKKYRYQWVSEDDAKDRADFAKLPRRGGKRILFEPDFALDKRETGGRWGKPAEHWQRFDDARLAGTALRTRKQLGKKTFDGWQIEVDDTLVRVPNPNAADCVNTVQKMAYKRGLVAAVVVVTNCSDAFTQDLDEEEDNESAKSEPEPPSDPNEGMAPPPLAPPPPGTQDPRRAIPEEMRKIIERVRHDPKELKPSYDLMWQQFSRRGEPAARAHEESNISFRNRFPKGMNTSTVEDHVTHLLDLWDVLQKYPEPVMP